MRIGLDVSCVARPGKTGIGWFASRLVEAMADLPGDHQFDLCYRLSRFRKRQHFLATGSNVRTFPLFPDPVHRLVAPPWKVFHGLDARLPQVQCPGIGTLYDLFNLVSDDFSDPAFIARKRHFYRQTIERADALLTISEATKRDIVNHLDYPAERIHVVFPACEEMFRPVPEDAAKAVARKHGLDRPYLLFVGNITKRKNTARMVEAFARLPESVRSGLAFVFVGDMAYGGEELQAAAQAAGVGSELRMVGYAEREDLPALYAAAEAFVFTTLYEGFGMPLVESMACGTPTLTSKLSAMPEVVGDAGLTVEPTSVEAIAQGMERLLTDSGLRESLRSRGLERAKAFTWPDAARKTLELYRRVAEQSA